MPLDMKGEDLGSEKGELILPKVIDTSKQFFYIWRNDTNLGSPVEKI